MNIHLISLYVPYLHHKRQLIHSRSNTSQFNIYQRDQEVRSTTLQ